MTVNKQRETTFLNQSYFTITVHFMIVCVLKFLKTLYYCHLTMYNVCTLCLEVYVKKTKPATDDSLLKINKCLLSYVIVQYNDFIFIQGLSIKEHRF